MRLNAVIITSTFLFVLAVLADHRRMDNQSRFVECDGQSTNDQLAGAFWVKNDGTFNFITGTFTVPGASGTNESRAIIWLGIDGIECTRAWLMAGIELLVVDSKTVYNAFCAFYPNPDYLRIFDFPIYLGDVIRISVISLSPTSGAFVFENTTKDKSMIQYINSTTALCGRDAGWAVEDYKYYHNIPFPNFGTVTFMDTVAYGPSSSYTADGACPTILRQDNQDIASVSIQESSVTIKHL